MLVSPREDLRSAPKVAAFCREGRLAQYPDKSDAGGVKVGLTDHAAVSEAVQDMAAIPAIASANVEGYFIEEWHLRDRRLSSAVSTTTIWPMVMVGLGGVSSKP